MAGIIPEPAGERGRGRGRLHHSWPPELRVEPGWGWDRGVFPLSQKPPLEEMGSVSGIQCRILGRGLWVGFPQPGFPRDIAGSVPRLPAFQRLPWELPASPLSPFPAKGVGGEREKRMWLHGDSSWGLGTHKPEGGFAVSAVCRGGPTPPILVPSPVEPSLGPGLSQAPLRPQGPLHVGCPPAPRASAQGIPGPARGRRGIRLSLPQSKHYHKCSGCCGPGRGSGRGPWGLSGSPKSGLQAFPSEDR